MRSTFSVLFYINRSRIKTDGTTAIMCRITIDGKNTAITTGIYCKPEDCNTKNGTVRTVREKLRLQEYRKYFEQIYEETLRTQGVISAEIIKNHVTRQFVVPTYLLQMGESERERLRVRSKEINSTSTYRSSQYYQKYLADYLTAMGKEDIAYLKKENIQNRVICYARRKTEQLLSVRIEPSIQRIIDRYSSALSPFVFPILTSTDTKEAYEEYQVAINNHNRQLRRLSKMLPAGCKLTSYTSRHSWATVARNHNVPISVISAGMGHTSEQTTQIYLTMLENSVIDDANQGLIRSLLE